MIFRTMKSLIFSLLLVSAAYANTVISIDNYDNTSDLIEIPEKYSSETKENVSWYQFKTDDCFMYQKDNLNEDLMRENGFRGQSCQGHLCSRTT